MAYLGGVEPAIYNNRKHVTSAFVAFANINDVELRQPNLHLYQQPHPHHHEERISYMERENNKEEISSSTTAGEYEIGEIDHALFLYLDEQAHHKPHDGQSSSSSSPGEGGGMRPPTLDIFPSQAMHIEPPSMASRGLAEGCTQPVNNGSKRALGTPSTMELSRNNVKRHKNQLEARVEVSKSIKREANHKGSKSSTEQRPKKPDPKTLRRLAQNREAARKSRLRKRAYVQQLESSRIRLAHLEHELHRASAQGLFLGGSNIGGDQGIPVSVRISPDAAVFDMEYTRWLEEHHQMTSELRVAVQEQVPEDELKIYVENCLQHYDLIVNLKSMVAKTDAFHLISGMWKTPAERCLLWLGGFRPSELIKIILQQIEPLTELQLIHIYGLQQATHEAEETLSQGLHLLHQSLSDVISADALTDSINMTSYMGQMALAMNKLSSMENFARQGDNLRHQTLHHLHQILTTSQAALCFLVIAHYTHRLRVLSSLYMSMPR